MKSLFLALIGTFMLKVSSAAPSASAFSGNFLISNLIVDSPFQANATNPADAWIGFNFADEDTPKVSATTCTITWRAGLSPSTGKSFCVNKTFHAIIPNHSYRGVANFQLNLSHVYMDNSIGDYPYNKLTKHGEVRFIYPNTTNYECNLGRAYCKSCDGTVVIGNVTQAWS